MMWFVMPLGTLLLLLLTTAWQLKKAMPLLTKLPKELNKAHAEVLHNVNRDAVCLHANFPSPSCLQVKPTLKLHLWFLNSFFVYLLAIAMPNLSANKLSPSVMAACQYSSVVKRQPSHTAVSQATTLVSRSIS
jgi:hypothetical protein